jgi:signal transduction histidine kinase
MQTKGAGEVSADPTLFRQAVSNLLSNALQYTPRGGRVTISVAKPDHECVEVTVGDTGSGIEPKHLPRILDRFYRADQSRSQYPHGSGLGLAIVKSIMSLHSGEATIASVIGKGTTAPPIPVGRSVRQHCRIVILSSCLCVRESCNLCELESSQSRSEPDRLIFIAFQRAYWENGF